MNGLPPHNGPMAIAKESIAMSKETGDRTFKVMAMVMMAAGGLATLLHAGHVLFRDMTAGRGRLHRRDDRPAGRPARLFPEEPIGQVEIEPGASWVQKARVAERADGERAWTEHAVRHGPARRH